MKPKNRKEILDICQNNFFNYSILTKIAIVFGLVASAGVLAAYIVLYIYPTICGIIYGQIIGWEIFWKTCLGYILYELYKGFNRLLISLGGAAMCIEEKWSADDFVKAWLNIYLYDEHTDDGESEK